MKYEHGSHAAYVLDRCRCDDCRAANRTYERERSRRIEPAFVIAHPAREHVRFLMDSGVGLKRIAAVSGVPHGTLSKLIYGDRARGMAPSKRVRKSTQDALLAVNPSHAADGAKIDAAATWQLIDELVAAGVPKARIAEAIGQTGPGLQLGRKQISARNARAVAHFHAAWKAGAVAVTRVHSRGVAGSITVQVPAPPAAPRPTADISDLILDLAEIVELRNSQPWRKQAACRGRPTYVWFPARGDGRTLDHALKICRSCLVRDQCRGEMFDEPVGVYGALPAGTRRRSREAETVNVRQPAACGTNAGYARHRRLGEDPCTPCSEEHARYEQDARRARIGGAA